MWQRGNPQQDTRPAGCLHVRWPRRVHEEGQGAFRWRAHAPRHDKAFARTGESADTGRTDQPSGHETKDILKQALLDFDGTLILVSHDRDFLDGLVSKVYEFGNKQVKEHLSGIYEFLEKKKMDSLRELER